MTGCDPRWINLSHLRSRSGTNLRLRRNVPIFYRGQCPAGAHPKNPLHLCYKKNSNRHSLPPNQRKNSCPSNKVCTQIITATPWLPSATSTAAVHAPPPPGPTCRTRAPHPWQRNVRFNFFISSGGRQMNYCSALSRNNAKNPPLHNNQSVACHASHVPPPPPPMPRTRASHP